MRENYRKPIASKRKLPQFITMNVIDGQASLVFYSSLIFYSLTIDNILNIVILLILAVITLNGILGERGLFKTAKNSSEEYRKQTATEKINLKIINSQIGTYTAKGRMPTIQELANDFCEDEEIQYVELASKKIGSLEKINIGENKSFFTKLKDYPYEFEINSSLQLASINGEKIANSDTSTNENETNNNELLVIVKALSEKIDSLEKELKVTNNKISTLQDENILVKKELDTVANEDKNPIGTIISYMGKTPPNRYLFCNGNVYNISDYKNLADQIKNEFGSSNYFGGNGTTTFAVPDLRGEFLRCTGTNSHAYSGSGENVGVHQAPTLSAICFSDAPNITVSGNISYPDWMGVFSSSDVYKYVGASTASFSKNRYASRPTNTSVLYCIKY